MTLAFLTALPALLFIIDPVGMVPIYLALTARFDEARSRATALKACLTAFGVLAFFGLFGVVVLQLFSVSLAAFRVAGGLLLLLTALDMLRAQPVATRTTPGETAEHAEQEDVAIVPLAMPLIAGPGAVATLMALVAQYQGRPAEVAAVLGAMGVAVLVTWLTLRSAQRVKAVLRQTGIAILERVFGLILAAIGVQFIFDGGRALLVSP